MEDSKLELPYQGMKKKIASLLERYGTVRATTSSSTTTCPTTVMQTTTMQPSTITHTTAMTRPTMNTRSAMTTSVPTRHAASKHASLGLGTIEGRVMQLTNYFSARGLLPKSLRPYVAIIWEMIFSFLSGFVAGVFFHNRYIRHNIRQQRELRKVRLAIYSILRLIERNKYYELLLQDNPERLIDDIRYHALHMVKEGLLTMDEVGEVAVGAKRKFKDNHDPSSVRKSRIRRFPFGTSGRGNSDEEGRIGGSASKRVPVPAPAHIRALHTPYDSPIDDSHYGTTPCQGCPYGSTPRSPRVPGPDSPPSRTADPRVVPQAALAPLTKKLGTTAATNKTSGRPSIPSPKSTRKPHQAYAKDTEDEGEPEPIKAIVPRRGGYGFDYDDFTSSEELDIPESGKEKDRKDPEPPKAISIYYETAGNRPRLFETKSTGTRPSSLTTKNAAAEPSTSIPIVSIRSFDTRSIGAFGGSETKSSADPMKMTSAFFTPIAEGITEHKSTFKWSSTSAARDTVSHDYYVIKIPDDDEEVEIVGVFPHTAVAAGDVFMSGALPRIHPLHEPDEDGAVHRVLAAGYYTAAAPGDLLPYDLELEGCEIPLRRPSARRGRPPRKDRTLRKIIKTVGSDKARKPVTTKRASTSPITTGTSRRTSIRGSKQQAIVSVSTQL
ncbi:hypothetical protein CC78DRAFT_546487 [Lojkania enalia]|uniref:Uncharacterized protein n=1 Tax=Lojkania enalia TaxID=147567 RepID=A0A9P4K653_9PLEO|nr:hypothetical protein CC78DRAFT_546487 [Didymosphaeria enalia]